MHALYRFTVAAWGDKGTQVPEAFRYPRPNEPVKQERKGVSWRELAQMSVGGR